MYKIGDIFNMEINYPFGIDVDKLHIYIPLSTVQNWWLIQYGDFLEMVRPWNELALIRPFAPTSTQLLTILYPQQFYNDFKTMRL